MNTEIVWAEMPAVDATGSIRVICVIRVRQWQFRRFREVSPDREPTWSSPALDVICHPDRQRGIFSPNLMASHANGTTDPSG